MTDMLIGRLRGELWAKVTSLKSAMNMEEATSDQLQSVVDSTLAELADQESDAARRAAAAGLNVEQLLDAKISVTEEGQGVEPITTTILVGIAIKVGSHVAIKFWDSVVMPRIERHLGVDALGSKEEEEDGDST